MFPAELHSDAMSVVRATRSTLPTKQSNRRKEDIGDLRELIESGDVEDLFHINGQTNPTDCLTKMLTKIPEASVGKFRRLMQEALYKPDFQR